MKKHRKNITIGLPEDVARWVRIEAAKNGTSTSAYISNLLSKDMVTQENYEESRQKWKNSKPYIQSSGQPYPSREDAHE